MRRILVLVAVALEAAPIGSMATCKRVLQRIALRLTRSRHACTSGGVDLTAKPYGRDIRVGQLH